MTTARRSNKDIRESSGRVDNAAFAMLSDVDIERFAEEDQSETRTLGEPRYVPPKVNLRELRERLGVSQTEFSRRFCLSLRSIQQWEQKQREPSDAARVLLYAIESDPEAIDRALHRPRAS